MFSDPTRREIEALIAQYPERRSALIPALQLVQKEIGHLPPDAIAAVAEIFELAPNQVRTVASFYAMLSERPVGKYVIQVCTNISCMLSKSGELMDHLVKRLRIKPGETTPDHRFTLLEVECLASCGTAPVVQINTDYYENLTPRRLDEILDKLE